MMGGNFSAGFLLLAVCVGIAISFTPVVLFIFLVLVRVVLRRPIGLAMKKSAKRLFVALLINVAFSLLLLVLEGNGEISGGDLEVFPIGSGSVVAVIGIIWVLMAFCAGSQREIR